MDKKFWEEKALEELSEQEWESLCMNCGKCCLVKYQYKDTIRFTDMICSYFDVKHCRCGVYNKRLTTGFCVKIDMSLLQNQVELLPPDCAYRRLFEGKSLPDYHYLLSGDKSLIHRLKKTVREMPVCSEDERIEQVKRKLATISLLPSSIVEKMMDNEIYLDRMSYDYLMYEASSILEEYEIPQKKPHNQ